MFFFKYISWLLLAPNIAEVEHSAQLSSPPSLSWKFSTGAPIIASPVVGESAIYIGSLDSSMYAIDKKSGLLNWKKKFHGDIRSAICFYNQWFAFVCGDGNTYMLSQRDGSLIWKFATRGERKYELYSYADYFYSSPVVDGDNLYFGSSDGSIYCIDATSGKLRWSFQTGSVVHATPLVQGDVVFAGSFDGNFYSLDKNSGKLIWKFKSIGHQYFPKGEFQGKPVADDKLVFVGSRDYNFYALNKKDGSGYWNRKFDLGWAMGVPLIHDSILYVGTSDDKLLLAMDPASGRIIWQTNLHFNIFGGSVIAGNSLFIGTLMGKLFGIDKRTGVVKWTWNTESYRKNRMTYFNDDDSYRQDITTVIKTGDDFITMYYALGAIFSTPVVAGQQLVVSSTDGNIYCFNLDGELQ